MPTTVPITVMARTGLSFPKNRIMASAIHKVAPLFSSTVPINVPNTTTSPICVIIFPKPSLAVSAISFKGNPTDSPVNKAATSNARKGCHLKREHTITINKIAAAIINKRGRPVTIE